MELLKKWLANPRRNYQVGVQLFNEYSHDTALRQLFNGESETEYKRQRLVTAIRAIADGSSVRLQEEAAQAAGQSAAAVTILSFEKTWPKDQNNDVVLQSLWDKAVGLLKKIAHLHSTLLHLPNDDVRREAAFNILRADEELDDIYQQRDYFKSYGHLPAKKTGEAEQITDAFLMAKHISNLSKYIRRERQNLRKDPENVEAAQRLKARIEEYNVYAKKMGKEEVKL